MFIVIKVVPRGRIDADTMIFSHLQPRFTHVHRRSPIQWDTLGQSERGRR